MGDFCSHFDVQAALPRHPISASLGQGPSKLDQSVHQMNSVGRKRVSGQNISIYYVLKLSGWTLERIGPLKSASRGLAKGE